MSTLRISDAPLLPDVDGTEKIPTGGRGDYAISVDQIKGHIFEDIGKELVGLGNVDNTSDLNKPVSTAQQAALNLKADKTYVDANLDLKADKTNIYTRSETSLALSKKADLVNGVIPENQIPSSFNDVLEFTTTNLPIVGESGKIYVTTDNNKTWRWGGNKYVEIAGWNPDSVSKKVTLPTYYTKEAGVDPVTGVAADAYFNVRSTEDDAVLDEYQNVGGVPTPSGKSYPSSGYVQEIAEFTALPFVSGKSYRVNDRVRLSNGNIARSLAPNNTSNPNTDKTSWLVEDAKTVDFSGLRLPTGTDISPLINPVLLKTLEQPIVLILPQGEFTLSTNLSTPAESKGIILDLNGAVLKPLANYRVGYVISLTSTTTFPAKVCNGTIDGINRDQNLFEVTDWNEYLEKATNGVTLSGMNVVLENMVLQNMYGQTTRYFCRHAITENVTIFNCGGHWYANNAYDAFGDAFYIGTGWNTTGLITAYFKNVKAVCKYSRQYPENHQAGSPLPRTMYSRVGLTIEKFGGSSSNEVRIHFENCDIRNVERGVHQELSGITTSLSLNNSYISSCVLFGAYLTDTLQTYATNCTFEFLDSDWLASRGVVRQYDGVSRAKLVDCTVRELHPTRQNIFGMGGTLEATRTSFINVGGNWGESLSLRLRDSTVNVTRHGTGTFPLWMGSTTLDNVNVTNIAGRKSYPEWANLTINKATFEDILISKNRSLSKMINDLTVIVPDEDTTDWRGYKLDVKNTSGNTVHAESVYWGVRPKVYADDKCVRYALTKPASGSLNIVTPEMLRIAEKSSLFVVVAKGQDSGALGSLDTITPVTSSFGNGYSVALARRDVSEPSGVKIVQPFSHVGNTGAYVLTFDGFNVTSYGSYTTYVHVAVVPYSELETLPQIPASFFSFLTPAPVAPASTPTA